MTLITALDPGPTHTAWLEYDGKVPVDFAWQPNETVLQMLSGLDRGPLVIEQVVSYGMPIGVDTLDTVRWSGRFEERYTACGGKVVYIPRRDVKMELTGNTFSKDGNVRTALLDRYGGERRAKGAIRCSGCNGKGWRGRGRPTCEMCNGDGWEVPPGPMYGVTSHCLSALALAVTYCAKEGVTV